MTNGNPGRSEAPTDKEIARKSPDDEIARQSRIVDLRGRRIDLALRQIFALVILALVLAQIAVADRIFWVYAEHNDWQISDAVIATFLGATVVEVIGVVLVIVNYLFPRPSSPDG